MDPLTHSTSKSSDKIKDYLHGWVPREEGVSHFAIWVKQPFNTQTFPDYINLQLDTKCAHNPAQSDAGSHISPFRDVVGLSGEPHESALHLDANVEGQQQVQSRGLAGQWLGQGQQGRHHGSRGMGRGVPSVVEIHGVNLLPNNVSEQIIRGPTSCLLSLWFRCNMMHFVTQAYRNAIDECSVRRRKSYLWFTPNTAPLLWRKHLESDTSVWG